MADVSDVENALLLVLQSVLMPGSATAPTGSSSPIRLYRGTPIQTRLAADIAAGVANVTIVPVPGSARNTTRWNVQVDRPPPMPGTTVLVSGASVTFGGVPAAGDLVGLLVGEAAFVYAVNAGDAVSNIAANLANSANQVFPCLQAGATLTFPTAPRLVARVTAPVNVTSEWGRQEQSFRIGVWCGSPTVRDGIGGTITSALATMAFITLGDQSAARIRYRDTAMVDDERDASVYRRDIIYEIEYPTTSVAVQPTVLFGDADVNAVQYFG